MEDFVTVQVQVEKVEDHRMLRVLKDIRDHNNQNTYYRSEATEVNKILLSFQNHIFMFYWVNLPYQ